jgi:Zn-dependent peptidase ImmA (M78 family)
MLDEKKIEADIFLGLKDVVDFLISRNDVAGFPKDLPLDIEAFAYKCGITDIQRVPPEIFIDGKSVPIKHAVLIGTVIFLNIYDNPEKQRFSIAHEIFHFLMRRPEEGDFLQAVARQGETWKKENTDNTNFIDETIADYFAANLLIPTEQFILYEDKTDEEIALVFGVEPRCIRKHREKEIEH